MSKDEKRPLRDNADLTEQERNEIREFAKNLYFECDVNGKQKYSFRDIAAKIEEVFNTRYSHITVFSWAKEGNWKDIFNVGARFGEQKALDIMKEKYDVDIEEMRSELVDDEIYRKKVAQIKRAVIMQQAQVVRKMKKYIDALPDTSHKIPSAGKSFSEANKILFEMIDKSPFGASQKLNLNIQVINPEKVNIGENN
jgi:uncharacterized protein (DUF1697 family)